MSRIGKKAISIPAAAKVSVSGSTVKVEGPNGSLQHELHSTVQVDVDQDAKKVVVKNSGEGERQARAIHGLTRALIQNMVIGVTTGYEKRLDVVGVGYQAKVEGKSLRLQCGFSHPVNVPIPAGVTVETPSAVKIIVKGSDKQAVGQLAAQVRRVRPPEPYNGKGIRYEDERVRRKAGKSFVSGG